MRQANKCTKRSVNRKEIHLQMRENLARPRRGASNRSCSSADDETDTEPDKSDETRTIVSTSESTSEIRTIQTTTAIVPQEVTEKRTVSNCLISTITHSEDGSTRFIPKDFFYKQDQRVNQVCKKKYEDHWVKLRTEIEQEIDQDLKLRMVRRAQQVGLYLKDQN